MSKKIFLTFITQNLSRFSFESKTFLRSNSARLIKENFQIEHKEISNKYGIKYLVLNMMIFPNNLIS